MRPARLFGTLGVLIALATLALLARAFFMPSARMPGPVAHVSYGAALEVPVWRPEGAARALVIHFGRDPHVAEALARAGAAVVLVDPAPYLARVAQDAAEHQRHCIYLTGNLTDLGAAAQRALGLESYFQPILSGQGEGAAIAYASLANAPVNTLTGALGAGYDGIWPMAVPPCPGPTVTPEADGARWRMGYDLALNGQALIFAAPDALAGLRTASAGNDQITLEPEAADVSCQLAAALDRLAPRAPEALPIVDLPALGPDGTAATPRALAVVVSGDGGWRDIDRQVGNVLAQDGLQVVGLDSLRYFWARREPARFAADLAQIVAQADPSGRLPVMLVGYSFGADALPFAVPLLPEGLRARLALTVLLAPGRRTDFTIHTGGWLGLEQGEADIPGAIAALDPARTLCVLGAEEGADSGCNDPRASAIPRLERPGGHHFDGDYATLTRLLLEHLPQR